MEDCGSDPTSAMESVTGASSMARPSLREMNAAGKSCVSSGS